jgi:hypothetical protein
MMRYNAVSQESTGTFLVASTGYIQEAVQKKAAKQQIQGILRKGNNNQDRKSA